MSLNLSSTLSTLTSSTFASLHSPTIPNLSETPKEDELSSDNDEPLLSGSGTIYLLKIDFPFLLRVQSIKSLNVFIYFMTEGEVSKDCSELELTAWAEALQQWGTQQSDSRPKQLKSLVRRGVPEALRGEVWLRLSGCSSDEKVMDAYRVLITKECSADSVILRDIHRTFPAHDFFKDSGGLGQEALAKISRAYAVYDEEVGYCQVSEIYFTVTITLH